MTAIKAVPPQYTLSPPAPQPFQDAPAHGAQPSPQGPSATFTLAQSKEPLHTVAKAVEDHIKALTGVDKRLTMEVNQDAGVVVYKAVDRATGEVIKQFPSDEIIRILTAYRRRDGRDIEGLAIDGKV